MTCPVEDAVADLRRRVGSPTDPAVLGPVPLAHFLAECNLRQVELPNLSRAAVYDFLVAEGIAPGDLGEDESLAGFLFATPSAGIVFVNANDAVVRRRFTAAHELGHFVLHRDRMGGRASVGDTNGTVIEADDSDVAAMEHEANRFAADLLMPAEVCQARAAAFRRDYGVCPLQPFAHHLAAELLVSPEAARYRLTSLEACDG